MRSETFAPAGERTDLGYGSQVHPVHTVGHPVNRVQAALKATAPGSTRVAIGVRGLDGTGAWTEWARTAGGRAEHPGTVRTAGRPRAFTGSSHPR